MRARAHGSLLLLVWVLSSCGRLRFEDLHRASTPDAGVELDVGLSDTALRDADIDALARDADGLPRTDGQLGPADSARDALVSERDARVNDAGVCSPGFAGSACSSCVRYVDRNASALHADGLSWQRAYPELLQALLVAASESEKDDLHPGCQVWVREGRYHVYLNGAADTIALSPRVPLYGGFAGSERDPSERMVAVHPSILDAADAQGMNHAYHAVVSLSGGLIDGFTLTGGRANDSSGPHAQGGGLSLRGGTLIARNVLFVDNAARENGGGIYAQDAALTLENARFERNVADGSGGAVAIEASGPGSAAALIVRGVDMRANQAGGHGGALSADGEVILQLENLVVAENVAGGGGGGVSLRGAQGSLFAASFHANSAGSGASGLVLSCGQSCRVFNSIFWDPSALPELSLSGAVTVRYNIVRGGAAGPGNEDVDPLFLAPSNDLHLRPDSPAIDSADGCAGPERDRDGLPRRDLPSVANRGVAPVFSDRGAYEAQTNGASYQPFSQVCR